MITEGCEIYGTVENSILFSGCKIEAGAVVKDSVVMKNAVVKKDAVVQYSIVDCDVTIGEGAVIGTDKNAEGADIAVIGCDLDVPAGTVIEGGAMVNAEKLSEILK